MFGVRFVRYKIMRLPIKGIEGIYTDEKKEGLSLLF